MFYFVFVCLICVVDFGLFSFFGFSFVVFFFLFVCFVMALVFFFYHALFYFFFFCGFTPCSYTRLRPRL